MRPLSRLPTLHPILPPLLMALTLQPDTLAKIEKLVPRYPTKRSAALPLLHLVQEDQGYVSRDAIEWIAETLEVQPINIYELVTFYPMFRQKPIGRRHIKVCRTLPCALAGSYKTCEKFRQAWGNVELGATSEDGEVTIEFVECQASCGTAPVVMIDDDLFENVGEEKAAELIEQIKKKAVEA